VMKAVFAWAAVYTIGAAIGLYVFLARAMMDALAALGHPFDPTTAALARISCFGLVFIVSLSLASAWLYAVLRSQYGPGPRTALLSGGFVWTLSVVAPVAHLAVFRLISLRFAALDLIGECVLILAASVVSARIYERSRLSACSTTSPKSTSRA